MIKDYLIDTGISSGHIRKLKRNNFKINNVLLSHWHEDHISGIRLLKDAIMHCHINDKPIIEGIENLLKKYYYIVDSPAEHLFDTILEGMRLKNTKIHEILNDKQVININNDYQLQVIHTPGHTAGHCCFLELNSKICFLGDIDLTSFGPWYAGLDSNLLDFESSILKLKQYDFDIAVTSHKGIFLDSKLIREEFDKFKSLIDQRDQDILNLLSEIKPKNINDLINRNIIYKFYGEFKAYDIIAEKIMIKMHLDKLLQNKKIEIKKNGFILN